MRTSMRAFMRVLLFGSFTTAAAFAVTQRNMNYVGTACVPTTPTEASKISYSQWGVQNNSTTDPAKVHCPGSVDYQENTSEIAVWVYDRNPTADVCCKMMLLNNGGDVLYSSNACSTGSGSALQSFLWAPPDFAPGTPDLSCSIPPVYSGNYSHVVSYQVDSWK